MIDQQLVHFPLYLAELRAKENEVKSRHELQKMVMLHCYQWAADCGL